MRGFVVWIFLYSFELLGCEYYSTVFVDECAFWDVCECSEFVHVAHFVDGKLMGFPIDVLISTQFPACWFAE